jgi:hypothetical protein
VDATKAATADAKARPKGKAVAASDNLLGDDSQAPAPGSAA